MIDATLSAPSWIQPLGWALVQFLWQGTLIAALFAGLRAALGRWLTAQGRYLLACGALAAMAAAPVVTFLAGPRMPAGAAAGAWPLASVADWRTVMPWLVLAWAAGVLLFSVRLLGAWRVASRLRSVAVQQPPDEWQSMLDRLVRRLRISRPVRLLVSPLVDVAIVQRTPVPEWVSRSVGGVGSAAAYYPGTASAAEAQPLTIGPGQELTGLSMVFRPPQLASISGVVTLADGRPASSAVLSLSQPMPFAAGGDGVSSAGAAIRPDGSFVVPNLPPGPYSLSARARVDGGESAHVHLVLDGADVAVSLVLGRGSAARGRILFDTGRPPANLRPTLTTIGISTRPADPDERSAPSGLRTVRDDWTFELAGLSGRRRLDVRPPSGWSVKSVRVGDIDIIDTPLEFGSRDVEGIEIVLTNRITEVTGAVRDERGDTVGDATVVLLADDPARWGPDTRFVAVVRPDQSGRFAYRGLPTARYIAVALEFLEPGEETNPEMLAKLRAVGAAFALAEGEAKVVELSLLEAPR